jgi:phage protein D
MALAVQPDYSEQEQQGILLVAQAEDLKVTDQASLDAAGEMLKSIKLYIAEVQKITGPVKAATHAAWKAAVKQETDLVGKAEEAERILKYGVGGSAITPILTSIAGFAREQKARKDAADAERERIQREAEAAARAKSKETGEPVQAVVIFTPPAPTVAKTQGVGTVAEWGFRITDESLIPREYLMVDEKKIRTVVKAMKKQTNIPGVEAIEGTGVRG